MLIVQLVTYFIIAVCLCRLLSDTVEHREAMLSCGALKAVATLLSSSESTILLSALKTVSCFIHELEFLLSFSFSLQVIIIKKNTVNNTVR